MEPKNAEARLRAAMERLRERLRPLDEPEKLTLDECLEVLDDVADVLAFLPDNEKKPDA